MREINFKEAEEKFDKKKFLVGLSVLGLLSLVGFGLYASDLFDRRTENLKEAREEVRGVSEEQEYYSFEENIQKIQEEVVNLDLAEVATSSPQVQKVLNDIKALENLPRNEAKNACKKICESL